MTYQTAFPDFDRAAEIDELIAAGWQDQSWHNDGCPRLHCGRSVLWIDYLDQAKSEIAAMGGESGQCLIEFVEADDGLSFPTIKEALGAFYVERIGYDPFADDPAITIAEVARTLVEHQAEADALFSEMLA